MKDYIYVVMSNPQSGREDEYNDWYTNRHLSDVVAVPGFLSARRFKTAEPGANGAPQQRYLAIYHMRTDDPKRALDGLTSAVEAGRVPVSDAINNGETATTLYEALCPDVEAGT